MAAGFSEYEAKVYLALLGEHPATGYQISKSSGVPRSMVYEALGRLHKRGAVLKSEENRATLYRPLPPDTLLDRFAQEYEGLMKSLRADLSKRYVSQGEERLWSISGRSSVLSYAAQMLKQATREVSIVLGDPELEALREDIQAVCGREVIVNALLTGEASLELGKQAAEDDKVCHHQIARHPPLESELHELSHMLLVVVDSQECLIASIIPDTSEVRGTITNNPNLVLIAWQFVWMELFTQRIYTNIGAELLDRLNPQDRSIFESLDQFKKS
jgi:Cd2+/Zn2+-exporting ATPase